MSYAFEEALEAVASVKKVAGEPLIGVVLGSGLGGFGDELKHVQAVPFTRIKNFPSARVEGHAGELLFGEIGNARVAVLSGRVHYYEGHDMHSVTLPTRMLALLGIRGLIVTNASGGIREDLGPGDLMLIEDHINLMGVNPLRGPWDPRHGARHPDMTRAYDPVLRDALHRAAKKSSVELKDGIYVAISGPSYETPAEIRMLRALGADAVGMSTVPEVTVANQMGLRVAGISCVANKAAGLGGDRLSHKEVMEETTKAAKRFCKLLTAAIPLVASVLRSGGERRAGRERRAGLEQRSVGARLLQKKGSRK